MKNALTLAAVLLALTLGISQETWYTQIPYETGDPDSHIRRLVQSSVDGSFFVCIQKVDSEDNYRQIILLFKYSSAGEYVWEKNTTFSKEIPWVMDGRTSI
ncbi:MAG: hypothetical protein IPJ40_16485 [Saprospirales bacterium]|nr:hypothetical protein [Saprospirales bacterium]